MYSLSIPTPLGIFCMIIDETEHVVAAGFGLVQEVASRAALELPETAHNAEHPYAQAIQAYFNKDYASLDAIPVRLAGTPFQQAVHTAMRTVAAGTTMSYTQLAELAHRPAAIRAVASSCRTNKIILLVPCHRIIRSNGEIGQYVYGSDVKCRLLEHEIAV